MSKISCAAARKHGIMRFCEYMWWGSEQSPMKQPKTKPLHYGRGFFLLFRFFTLLFHGFVCAGNHLFRECLFLLVLQIHPCDADNIHPCQINLDVLLHGKHLIYRLIAHQRHNLRANLRAHQIGLANFCRFGHLFINSLGHIGRRGLLLSFINYKNLHCGTVLVDEILRLNHLLHTLFVQIIHPHTKQCQNYNNNNQNIRKIQNSSSFIADTQNDKHLAVCLTSYYSTIIFHFREDKIMIFFDFFIISNLATKQTNIVYY